MHCGVLWGGSELNGGREGSTTVRWGSLHERFLRSSVVDVAAMNASEGELGMGHWILVGRYGRGRD